MNLRIRPVEAFLQIENDLSTLGPKQMVPGAVGTAFDKPDREDIDVPRGDLERIAAVIKQLWMPSIECDVDRRMGGRLLITARIAVSPAG